MARRLSMSRSFLLACKERRLRGLHLDISGAVGRLAAVRKEGFCSVEIAGPGPLARIFVGCWAGVACSAYPTLRGEAPVHGERTSVGLDVHARSVAAAAIDGVTGELRRARLTPSHDQIRSWIGELAGPVAVAYEAGPTGFGLYRALTSAGVRCVVAAPSKLQRPSGDRVKTDARDAVHLARLLRLGEITAVTVPTLEQEAARDLVRAREDCRGDLMRARHRLSKLLLRQGIVYSGGSAWTGMHDSWLRRQRFDNRATELAYESDYETMLAVKARRDRLDAAITAAAADSEFTPLVRRLACLRGVSTLTAFALAVEIGDWHRFTGNSIGCFVGLVPSEHSSGASRVQGAITKAGNSHARRLLVEAAWHHRPAYRPGTTLRARWELAPPAARVRGDAGNRRLHERWVSFNLRKKRPVIANVAIARELAGWCWSLAVLDDT
jgi:transposase